MKNKRDKIIKINKMLLKQVEVKRGLTPERITAKIQEQGVMFTYRQYKEALKSGSLPRANGSLIKDALERMFSCDLSIQQNEKDAA